MTQPLIIKLGHSQVLPTDLLLDESNWTKGNRMTGFALYICAPHVDRSQSLFYFVPQEKNSSASGSTPLASDIIIRINDPLTQPLGKK